MRRVIGIGETVLDIIFKDDQPIGAVPGGSVFNGIISLGRSGVSASFISEAGNDRVGRSIIKFLRDNGVDADAVNVYPDSKSPISLAFLDEKNDAEYIFYKDHPRDQLDFSYPPVSRDDVVMRRARDYRARGDGRGLPEEGDRPFDAHRLRVGRVHLVELAQFARVLHRRRFAENREALVQGAIDVQPVPSDHRGQYLLERRPPAMRDDEVDDRPRPGRLGVHQGAVEIEKERGRPQLTSPCRSTSCTSCPNRRGTGRCVRPSAPRAQWASRRRNRRRRTSTRRRPS